MCHHDNTLFSEGVVVMCSVGRAQSTSALFLKNSSLKMCVCARSASIDSMDI